MRPRPDTVSAAPPEKPAEPAVQAPVEAPVPAPAEPAVQATTEAPAEAPAEVAAPAARASRWRRFTAVARLAAPRSAVAAVGGCALALAFPPYGVWPLSVLAVAALALVLEGRTVRQAAWLGFAFAFPFFLWLLVWLRSVIWLAVPLLSAVEAAYLVLMAALIVLARRLPWWPLWTACLWVAQELVRDRLPFGGFPWGRLAFANTGSPYTPLAALGGAPLVTFAVALSGTLLAAAALAGHRAYTAHRALPPLLEMPMPMPPPPRHRR